MRDATRERLLVVGIWATTKLLVLGAVAWANASLIAPGSGLAGYVGLWRQWDTKWFESIAIYGYVGPYVSGLEDFRYNVAFFPGYPLLMDLGEQVGLSPVLAGLIISAVASLIASFGIARLVTDIGGQGHWGVVALFVAPTALFLTAAYTEALFCAFAFWSWVFARRQQWVWAGLLAGGAAFVRSNGLFLMAGLLVLFLVTRPWRLGWRTWAAGTVLLAPLVATGAYFAYLWSLTGRWNTWQAAQADYWERHLVDPITSLVNTYQLIFTFSPTGEPSSRMATEILAMAVILASVVILLVKKWWAEATYVAVTAIALGTSTMYHSVPRTIVVLFPLWMLLGLWLTRYRWLRWVYVLVGVPSLVLVAIRFTQEQWIS